MLVDRRTDRVGVARGARVLGADVALKIGKLPDELRSLVGLREPRRLTRIVVAAEPLDERDEPFGLVGKRACALEERNRVEPGGELLDPDGEIALEGESGVVEPALEHTLVASDHELRVAPVRDEREPRAGEREVALVGLHRGLDHAGRQREEALVEPAFEDGDALDEVDDLLELPERVAPAVRQRLDDLAAPLGGIGLDTVRAERVRVTLRRRNLDPSGGEAVAERGAVAEDDCLVEPGAEPAHRTREPKPVGLPLHRLRERKRIEHRRKPLGQRLAGHLDAEEAVALLELVDRHAVTLREAGGGLVPERERRALDPLRRRLTRDVVDDHREPAWPDVECGGLSAEVLEAERRQLGLRFAAGGGRQLLAADLKQQRRHPPPPVPR